MQTIRDSLMQHWDPIGVAAIPEAVDEYDSYIGAIYAILTGTRSEQELVEFLHITETETMGLGGSSRKHLRKLAHILLNLDVGR